MPISVSKPWPVSWATPWMLRSTVTPAIAPTRVGDAVPAGAAVEQVVAERRRREIVAVAAEELSLPSLPRMKSWPSPPSIRSLPSSPSQDPSLPPKPRRSSSSLGVPTRKSSPGVPLMMGMSSFLPGVVRDAAGGRLDDARCEREEGSGDAPNSGTRLQRDHSRDLRHLQIIAGTKDLFMRGFGATKPGRGERAHGDDRGREAGARPRAHGGGRACRARAGRLRDGAARPRTGSGGSTPMSAPTGTAPRRRRSTSSAETATHIGVGKMRGRCNNAAYVTAELDLGAAMRPGSAAAGCGPMPARGVRGADLRCGRPADRRRGWSRPTAPIDLALAVPDTPWHIYDFDLASLTITAQYRPRPARQYELRHALALARRRRRSLLRYLGRADLRFVRAERHRRPPRACASRRAGRPSANRGGPIWFDAAEGHIIEASWGIPNHSEHRDFRLRLTGSATAAPEEWRRLLTAHFEGCPAR